MTENYKFCTIHDPKKDKWYDCTVKTTNGNSSPKDIWDGENWIPYNRFTKENGLKDFTITGYRNDYL